ncbi:protein LHCP TRANSLOCATION DEFECT-like [Actinidia eriantha]|uniref:protein LHCP TRANSLOCATION DEFECT-like n=1 Tax=Actinidia eriantha TaxID=165200 RepID=UPI00258B0693|nr:protein LHCP TRANSLOCATION DEFECT-like [Actinidia eriantha]
MASMPCTLRPIFAAKSLNSSSSSRGFAPNLARFGSRFLGSRIKPGSRTRPGRGGLRITCWFKFGKNGVDAEGAGIYGSQSRDDFDRDDVEQYFNYMGMLAVEGTYDKLEKLLSQNIHPVDILLMMAASEGDKPKIEELLRAGASYTVKDANGLTALDKAGNEEIKDFIRSFSAQKA